MVDVVSVTVVTMEYAKAHLSEIVESAEANHERTIITKDGRPAVVIISAADLQSIEETLAILSDPHLMAAVRGRADEPSEPITKDEMMARLAARRA